MSLSEARRLVDRAFNIAEGEEGDNNVTARVLARGFSALVEALAENKPYDGTLNEIRVSFTDMRSIILEAQRSGLEDIGLEDLIISLRARGKSS